MDSKIKLYEHQIDALNSLVSGSILNGGVGSGKTLTALSYYLKEYSHRELYVITTAKKRNSNDWQEEASLLGITEMVVDSWNNISNYDHLYNAFIIFDEQRLVGYGAWVKTFLKLAKKNKWILLSATPGDVWMDYMPVFVANGFYRNKTDFINQHVEYNQYVKFPQIKRYHGIRQLERYRDTLLVDMSFERHTIRHDEYIKSEYDKKRYINVLKDRWNPFKDAPIENVSEYTQALRRAVAESEHRLQITKFIFSTVPKLIVFYNYNYELEVLRELCISGGYTFSEWNGKRHEEIPETNSWVYLVQYTAGAEGWNCVETDTILFYSPNYSYKIVEQAKGRIDRLNTQFTHLYYIHLYSDSEIDKAVLNTLSNKTKFNEKKWGLGRFERKRISSTSNNCNREAFPEGYSPKTRPKL